MSRVSETRQCATTISLKGRDAVASSTASASAATATGPCGATAGASRPRPLRRAAAAHEDDRVRRGRGPIARGQLAFADAAEARPASANGLSRRK